MKMNNFVEVSSRRVWSGNVKDLLGLFCIFRTNDKIVSGWVLHFTPDTFNPIPIYDKNNFRVASIQPELLNMKAECDIYNLKCGAKDLTPPITKLPVDITYSRQDVLVYEKNHYEFKDIDIDLDRVYPFMKGDTLCFIRFSDVNKEKIFIKEAIGDVAKEYTAKEFYNTFEDAPDMKLPRCCACPFAWSPTLLSETEDCADED